jgi:maleylacetoacetate isomerase
VLRVYRIPFSTNVERVALAAGHKRLEVDWVDVDPADRSEVERISGQPLVPVLVHESEVVVESVAIVRALEHLHPEPPLWPAEESLRAQLDLFLDWFDRVWKVPPNAIEAERARAAPDADRIRHLAAELSASRDLFERLLGGRDYLLGPFSAADCAAFPFLKHGLIHDAADDEEFHLILREHLELEDAHPRLESWIRRVDSHPRA